MGNCDEIIVGNPDTSEVGFLEGLGDLVGLSVGFFVGLAVVAESFRF